MTLLLFPFIRSAREERMTFHPLWGAAMSVTIFAIASAILIAAASQAQAQAQHYPDKPVTIISDSAAGSTPDAMLRSRSAQPDLGSTNLCSESPRRDREYRFANRSRRSARRVHALHAGDIQLRGTAGIGAQCADRAAAGLYRNRLRRRKSFVHCSQPLSPHRQYFRSGCPSESASGRNVLRCHRYRQTVTLDGRALAKPVGHKAADRSVYWQPGASR